MAAPCSCPVLSLGEGIAVRLCPRFRVLYRDEWADSMRLMRVRNFRRSLNSRVYSAPGVAL
jgi:hypothetical protein